VEFNSFGPAVGRLGSDSSRGGGKVEAGGLSPLAPLTLTTATEPSGSAPASPEFPPDFRHCVSVGSLHTGRVFFLRCRLVSLVISIREETIGSTDRWRRRQGLRLASLPTLLGF